jgi:hypothetical protein
MLHADPEPKPFEVGVHVGDQWDFGTLDVLEDHQREFAVALQPFGTFRVLFNAVLFGDQLSSKAAGAANFWKPPVKISCSGEPYLTSRISSRRTSRFAGITYINRSSGAVFQKETTMVRDGM